MKAIFIGKVLGYTALLLIARLACFPGLAAALSPDDPGDYILPTSESDSLALVAFFSGTDGQNWTNKTNWLSGPVATWYGVTVMDGRVTRLEMPSNNVRFPTPRADPNQIPPQIGDLTMLEVLDLHFNSLNADVPAEIGNLANLKVLNLAGNGIGGPIPPDIGNLAQLEFLDLSRNQIGGKLPGEIGNLLQLRELYLYRNYQLKGVIPEGVDRMMQLETVDISQNRLEDLPDLSSLDPVSGNGSLVSVKIDENRFSFKDIEPNIGHSFQFSYASQYVGGSSKDALVYEGDSLIITYDIGGEYNTYQWYRDDEAIVGETSDRYVVGPVTRDAVGVYHLEIKNTLVTDLILTTPNQDIKYEEEHSAQWLDIGAYHHAYNESGARHWVAETPTGREYPAIQRFSSHAISSGFWVGVKDWTDAQGTHYPYYVGRMGPNESGAFYTYPIQNKLIGRYPDTIVEVNGELSFDNEAILDDVDPGLPADRMVHNIHNLSMGIEVDRKAYAYTNEYHDNYHIIEYTYCNTGNIDDDDEIELPEQTLQDVIFYRMNRWRGHEQGARIAGGLQHILGRYTIFDVVGDGYEEYPVDFTAQYAWLGSTLDISLPNASRLGIPLFSDEQP
ncbi:MAG: hypothetical protein KTR29_15180, partial [Rhodothermaceae bacterium]|nr:hypothetical protein [Rhodothermaceae bacterium]